MSNSDVFGSPMILTGKRPVSPFGAASYTNRRDVAPSRIGRLLNQVLAHFCAPTMRQRRVRRTVVALSKLDDHVLRDIGLNRSTIVSAAEAAEERRRETFMI